MDERIARSLAKDLVTKLLEPMFSGSKYKPLTIVELMFTGAYFTRSMVEFGFDPLDDELYSIFATFPPDSGRLEELLFRRLMIGKENAGEIIEAKQQLKQLTETPGSYRRIAISMLKDAIPAGTPGRTKKIDESDLPQLAALSDHLVRACKSFLALRKQSRRSTSEILEFLAADFPEQIKYLFQHQQPLEELLQDKKFLRTARTEKSRSRLIADAMAGSVYRLKPSYAARRAKEARRKRKVEAITKGQK